VFAKLIWRTLGASIRQASQFLRNARPAGAPSAIAAAYEMMVADRAFAAAERLGTPPSEAAARRSADHRALPTSFISS
jgi:hypothetical protein